MHTASKLRFMLALVPAILLFGANAERARADVTLPDGKRLESVDFERHIMGILGRSGCNGGSCHGSFQGKGGFRLSLFGYEPEKDLVAITRDSNARRINPADPDNSLLLLKAIGAVEHGGGMRFSKDSWQYNILRDWMQKGAHGTPGSGTVAKIILSPEDMVFKKAKENYQIQVKAQFTDGSVQDITSFCDFRTNDDAVADVTNLGMVKSIKPGSTAIVVSYRGNVLPVRVMIPMELKPGFAYPKVPEVNYVDHEVFARLRQLNMVPSDLATDEEFLRRVTIDTIGQLPSPDEIRAFAKDMNPNKRAKKIDDLLDHPLHAAMWATKFSDITGNDTPALEQPVNLKPKRSQQWHDWLRVRFQQNMPYDQIVKGILTATSRDGKTPEDWLKEQRKLDESLKGGYDTADYAKRDTLDLYWRRQAAVPIEIWGERTAAAFLGVRVECAQCHKHPFDRWTQAEYRAYANIFTAVSVNQNNPETKQAIAKENAERKGPNPPKNNNQINLVTKEVYLGPITKGFSHPDTNAPLGAKALGGPEIKLVRGQDPRVELFNWMRSPDNPFFSRSLVNRIWGHYTGLGIVHPVDDFSIGNPPSNEKLLDALAKDFVGKKFDFRHIERIILNSRTYQLSSRVNETNKFDTKNYAHAYIRPMIAEAVVDVLNSAFQTTEKFGVEVKPGVKAVEVGTSLLGPQQAYAFRIFGRPPRTTACDCERAMEPALPQKLFLMTDPQILAKFNEPSGRVQKLLKSKMSDNELLDELFLATLTRYPTPKDRKSFADHLQMVGNRREAVIDTMWALINTREFILNH